MGSNYEREGVHWHRRDDGSWLRFNPATGQWEAAERPPWAPPDPTPATWPAPPSAPVAPPPGTAGGAEAAERPKYPFKSRLTAGANLKALLGLAVLVGAVAVVAEFQILDFVDGVRAGRIPTITEASYVDARTGFAVGVSLLVLVVTGIIFISWLYVAYKNLIPLGAARLGRRAGWAIGGWFVPFVNLALPKLIVDEVYRQSDPEVPTNVHPDARISKVSPVVHWWWGLFLFSNIVERVAWVMMDERIVSPDEMYRAISLLISADIAQIAAGILCFIVVHRISHRQEQRAQRLGIIGGAPAQPATAPS
jgi:hypothetical protein